MDVVAGETGSSFILDAEESEVGAVEVGSILDVVYDDAERINEVLKVGTTQTGNSDDFNEKYRDQDVVDDDDIKAIDDLSGEIVSSQVQVRSMDSIYNSSRLSFLPSFLPS